MLPHRAARRYPDPDTLSSLAAKRVATAGARHKTPPQAPQICKAPGLVIPNDRRRGCAAGPVSGPSHVYSTTRIGSGLSRDPGPVGVGRTPGRWRADGASAGARSPRKGADPQREDRPQASYLQRPLRAAL